MEQTKRSKRHRTGRNHISTKDLVMCITDFAEHAQRVERERKAQYPAKFGINTNPEHK